MVFDFDKEGILVGIEIIGEDDEGDEEVPRDEEAT